MRRTLATFALLFAWLCANGALLDAMQVFAWARMLTGYSQTMSFTRAVQETFDPAKPCELCRGVAKAKETRRQQPMTDETPGAKFVLTLQVTDAPIFVCDRGEPWAEPHLSSFQRTDPVPVPPPRA